MANNFRITPVDSAELSYKTKLALIELIRGSQGDAPFKLPNEDLLAQKIGVSRNALRDALASLEEMGFVTRQRSKGTLANPKVAREIAQATGADYLHLLPSEDLFFLLSQVYALPSTFFVDSEGNQIGSLHLGMKTKEQWAALIEEMLEEVS